MQFLIETNPAFLLIDLEDNNFIFYNSLQHRASKLSYLEMIILDMYYKYQDKNYIINQFKEQKRELITNALHAIDSHKLLLCEELKDTDYQSPVFPSTYYIHLTYNCNLKCTYCYNKEIRDNFKTKTLTLDDWKIIIEKIASYAKAIILTGGEFFLYPDLIPLLKFIKQRIPDVTISGISNGMHSFENGLFSEALDYLSSISFSCDSISKAGERIGFNPSLYTKNIKWIKQHYPKIHLTIASTITNSNKDDLKETDNFCKSIDCSLSQAVLIPGNASEVDLMPELSEIQHTSQTGNTSIEMERLKPANIRCGAGKSICSIDPIGNIYPCQSLHYEEFLMGNILRDSIENIRQFGKHGYMLKTVNDFPVCSKCKVKYICGGGCPATGYTFYGNKLKNNHLTCAFNYINSIKKLKSLNNR